MSPIHVLVVRDEPTMSSSVFNLIIALVALIGAAISLGLGFYLLRRMRATRIANLHNNMEVYSDSEKQACTTVRSINHRGLTLSTSKPHSATNLVVQERLNLINNSTSPPCTPIPEIRITFPDEMDAQGKRQSGRVVVVKVGETSVGLEPLRESDEKCPPYMAQDGERFQSLDLERIGGLKEAVQERRFA